MLDVPFSPKKGDIVGYMGYCDLRERMYFVTNYNEDNHERERNEEYIFEVITHGLNRCVLPW